MKEVFRCHSTRMVTHDEGNNSSSQLFLSFIKDIIIEISIIISLALFCCLCTYKCVYHSVNVISNILFRSTGDKEHELNNLIAESNSDNIEETATQSPMVT